MEKSDATVVLSPKDHVGLSHIQRDTKSAEVCIVYGLVLLTTLVFWSVRNFDFVNFDDPVYVYENSIVRKGLTYQGVKWAFTSVQGFYHPVTWLSLMADTHLYGVNAGPIHLTNVLIHTINVLLVLLTLHTYTHNFWRSAAVSALFAIHPVNVESVVWISERKGLLAGTFLLCSLLAYYHFIATGRFRFYLAALAAFALSLLAKPAGIMLPLILVALDYWPLRRISCNRKCLIPLAIEKVPFLCTSFAACFLGILAQYNYGAISVERDVGQILANAAHSCTSYILSLIFPTNLCVFYPIETISPSVFGMCLLLLFLIVVVMYCLHQKYPCQATALTIFLLLLIPVLGFLPIGGHARADRYLYLPGIFFFIFVVWSTGTITSKLHSHLKAIGFFLLLACLVVLTGRQITTWSSSKTLFSRVLRVTKNNYIAHINYGSALAVAGDHEGAELQFRRAIAIRPTDYSALYNLALSLKQRGRIIESHQIIVHLSQ